ncbi:hypothetical protein WJX81_006929 [Elliptochloris bilobata]|uniref:peptidylprolyl isomerase n=1 Tax=Elliptochloris bilobata TaxID=381761 RepID=A0AAW1SK80_9CHLO
MVHYVCRDEDGNLIDTSREQGEPVTFEVGAGEAVGNPLFQAFDAAVRGLSLGETTTLEAQGGEWRRDLLFEVPREHPEIQRLEGRYRSQGGLREGMLVELANGDTALVLAAGEHSVRLDANNMMAGKARVFELELVALEPGQ